MLSKGVLVYHDNAPAQTTVATATIHDCGFEIIPHPPLFTRSCFHLFPNIIKLWLADVLPMIRKLIMKAVEEFLNSQSGESFSNGIKPLQHRWSKCVSLFGDGVEKQKRPKLFVLYNFLEAHYFSYTPRITQASRTRSATICSLHQRQMPLSKANLHCCCNLPTNGSESRHKSFDHFSSQ